MKIQEIRKFKKKLKEGTYDWRIVFRNRWLDGYFPNGLAGGMKAFHFSSNGWFSFESEREAYDKIKQIKNDLYEWITYDIPSQAKDWGDYGIQKFLDEENDLYKAVLKNVEKFKVKEYDRE